MNPPMANSMQAMEVYSDNLMVAAINENQVLEEMVKIMAKLTETNEVFSETNAGLTHQLTVMQNWKFPSVPTGLSNPNPRGIPHLECGGGPRHP